MQKPTQNLSDNKAASPNFVRSSQESSSTNSLMTNTNDATKGKKKMIKAQKLNKQRHTKLQTLKMKKHMTIT